jgi:hypothetical protein
MVAMMKKTKIDKTCQPTTNSGRTIQIGQGRSQEKAKDGGNQYPSSVTTGVSNHSGSIGVLLGANIQRKTRNQSYIEEISKK